MNGTFNYNNKDNNVYKDNYADLEFIFTEGQEQVFWDLLKRYEDVNKIPEDVLLTGMYFNKNTRDLSPIYENSLMRAKYITK